MNGGTHCSHLFKMTDVTAHHEGCRSHEKVQHSSSQDRNIGLLPGQRLKEMSGEQKTDEKMDERRLLQEVSGHFFKVTLLLH